MTRILNIDTSTGSASVCLSKDGAVLALAENNKQQDHASWLHLAVTGLLRDTGLTLKALDAVAVTAGPGSYTGLRVGMAAAKGFSYALGIPFITEISLKVMALAAREQTGDPSLLYCPLIDARRMEVFTAIYDHSLAELLTPTALILEESAFDDWLGSHRMFFFGDGSGKWKTIAKSPRAQFGEPIINASFLGILSYQKFVNHEFTDIIYSEPVYTKEFYTHTKK